MAPILARTFAGYLWNSTLDDLQVRAQGAGRLHRLQDGEQVLRRGADRVQRFNHFAERYALDDGQGALVLADLDLGPLGLHGLALRKGVGLADYRLGVGAHRQAVACPRAGPEG